MRYLYASLIVLFLAACVAQQIEVGESKYLVIQTVQDEWCILDGVKVNGSWKKFITERMPVYHLCISLQSDDVEGTIRHELRHLGRDAIGLDYNW